MLRFFRRLLARLSAAFRDRCPACGRLPAMTAGCRACREAWDRRQW